MTALKFSLIDQGDRVVVRTCIGGHAATFKTIEEDEDMSGRYRSDMSGSASGGGRGFSSHQCFPQFGVKAASVSEFRMTSAFDDPAVVDHHDFVRVDDGGKSVGDDDGGPSGQCDS